MEMSLVLLYAEHTLIQKLCSWIPSQVQKHNGIITPWEQSEMDRDPAVTDFYSHSLVIDFSLAAVSSLIDLHLHFDRELQTKEMQGR